MKKLHRGGSNPDGEPLSAGRVEYLEAAQTINCSVPRLIMKHILPNSISPIIVSVTMGIGNTILMAASLSYIGLGVTPPQPSWGQLIKAAGETFRYYPYQFIIPCLCVSITMLCFNLIGAGLRDALDPKLRA